MGSPQLRCSKSQGPETHMEGLLSEVTVNLGDWNISTIGLEAAAAVIKAKNIAKVESFRCIFR